MRTFILFTVLNFSFGLLFSQQEGPNIVFDNLQHDFGTIKEEAGKANCRFVFSNTGSQPLVVTRVQTSCGCASSNYTRQPVATGGKGFVEVSYDPAGRPGPFAKTITVYSNGINPTTVLTIKGTVTPKPRTIEDDYPRVMGDLRLQNNHFSFMNVFNTEKSTTEIPVVNVGETSLIIGFDKLPSYLTIQAIPSELKPNEKGVLKAVLDASKVNDYGFIVHRTAILLNGQKPQNSLISVTAVIKEDFSKLTQKELAKAPKIQFKSTDFDFKTVKAGDVVSCEFEFVNEGKTPLIIRKVKTGCGCTASTPPTESIKPGESSAIKVSFNTRNRSGRQAQYIDVYCNDPNQPEIKLKIGGVVEKE
ncbi:MAG: DUF1573 domain-containing protein [Salinivirgaceae bacterium]|jgi:hypothetical protein|nr:DUF1573 domain-containing protein [Bacteroidales bacterium]